MRLCSLFCFMALAAGCGSTTETTRQEPPIEAETPPPSPAVEPAAQPAVEVVATELGKALVAGDRPAYLALTISHEQLAAIATKEISRDEWQKETDDFFDDLAGEFAEAKSEGKTVAVTSAVVLDTRTLSGEKVRQPTETAMLRLVLSDADGEAPRGPALVFIHTNAGWRFSPKK